MKRMSVLILAAVMCFGMMNTVFAAEFGFLDVEEGDWFYYDIKTAVESELINGKSETTYAPYDNLTYAEAIKLAACMNQLYLNGEVTLANGNPWYKPYVDYCKDKEIITKEYNYDENVTRAGYMEIFANALPDDALKAINNVPDGSISDVKVSSPYAIYVYKLYRAGVVTGVDEKHNCNPDASIIRAEVATILSRMMDTSKRKPFDMNDDIITNNGKINDNENEKNKTEEIYENSDVEVKVPTQTVDSEDITVKPTKPVEGGQMMVRDNPFDIYRQPESYEAENYGGEYELSVKVDGGKGPYSFEWFYYTGYRNSTEKIEYGEYVKEKGKTGDYVTDVSTSTLVVSIEKENNLLGKKIYCVIKDAEGTEIQSNKVTVYGPFSMSVDEWTLDSGKNILEGRVADGVLRKDEKISVIRNGKVIAIGIAEDLQMFSKSMDEISKGDNVGIVFADRDGALPSKGDIVVKYQSSHVLDTSDIIN